MSAYNNVHRLTLNAIWGCIMRFEGLLSTWYIYVGFKCNVHIILGGDQYQGFLIILIALLFIQIVSQFLVYYMIISSLFLCYTKSPERLLLIMTVILIYINYNHNLAK